MVKTKRKTVSKTVSFYWQADIREFRWAKEPQDVPIWDPSRGFPLDSHLYGYLTKGGPGSEVKRAFQDACVTRLEESLNVELDEAQILALIRNMPNRSAWEPKPAPQSNYPRLVWAHPFDCGEIGPKGEGKILNLLSSLVRDKQDVFDFDDNNNKRLQNEILAITKDYGPLSKLDDLKGNTYSAWIKYAYLVQTHIDALWFLEEYGLTEMRGFLADKDKQWLSDLDISFPPTSLSPYGHILLTTKDASDTVSVRNTMIGHCYSRFSSESDIRADTKSGYMLARTPISGWVQHELAHIWMGKGQLKTCEGCDSFFVAYNKKALVCLPRCRVRKHTNKTAA